MKFALASLSAVLALSTTPAHAGGFAETTLLGTTLTYSVQDATFDGPGCAPVRWTIAYTKPQDAFAQLNLTLTKTGTTDPVDGTTEAIFDDDPAVGILSGSLCIEATSTVGQEVFLFGGDVEATTADFTDGQQTLRSLPVSVSLNPSRLTLSVNRRTTKLKGKVVARTVTKGLVPADGTVRIERLHKGSWRTVKKVTPSSSGRFKTTIGRSMKIRASLSGCGWCTPTTRTLR